MPEHGETYSVWERHGRWTVLRVYRWCANHKAINLFTCENWDDLHGTGTCERIGEAVRQAEVADFERMARAKTETRHDL